MDAHLVFAVDGYPDLTGQGIVSREGDGGVCKVLRSLRERERENKCDDHLLVFFRKLRIEAIIRAAATRISASREVIAMNVTRRIA